MTALIMLLGVAPLLGIALIWGANKTPQRRPKARRTLSRATWIKLLGGVAAGVLLAFVTHWPVMVIAGPAAFLGLPIILRKPESMTDIAKLEALGEWVRKLAGSLVAGNGVETAIVTTASSVAPAISAPVQRLAARISAKMNSGVALRRFAQEINDSTGDEIAAYLILAAQRPGSSGLAESLDHLSDSVTMQVQHRRAIQADREKPRRNLAMLVVMTVIAPLLVSLLHGAQTYATPLGQVILAGTFCSFGFFLYLAHQRAQFPPYPRFMTSVEDLR